MLITLALAAFLIAHGLVHVMFLTPPPEPSSNGGGPTWPFELDRSWALGPLGVPSATIRLLGLVLVALTVATFCLAGIVTLGIAPDLWSAAVAVAATVSLVLLGLFYRPWLTLGIGIDLVLLWVALSAAWVPSDTLV